MANGTGTPPPSDPNDLLSQILATLQRMEAGGKGDGDAARGSRSRKGWQPSSDDFGGMTREVQDKIDRELKALPAKYRNNLRNYTVEVEHPDGAGALKRSWLHLNKSQPQTPWGLAGYNSTPTMAQVAGDAGAGALKPIAASLAGPLAMGFGDALGKSRGWREMDDGLQRMARRLRESGGAVSGVASAALSGLGMMTTGPLAIVGGLAASVGLLNQTATSMLKFQASTYGPLNEHLSLVAARMEVGEIRRNQQVGGMISGSADELGKALSGLKDALVPVQAFGLNAFNKVASAGIGVVNQGMSAVAPMATDIMNHMPAFLAGGAGAAIDGAGAARRWSMGVGQTAFNMMQGIGGIPSFLAFPFTRERGEEAKNDPKVAAGGKAISRLSGAGTSVAYEIGNLLAPGFGGSLVSMWEGAKKDAQADPAMQAQIAADKQADAERKAATLATLEKLEKLSKEKPANVVAAGMAQATIESAKAAVTNPGDVKAINGAWDAGMTKGMADEEARVKAAEAADAEVMKTWTARVNEMSDWHLRNPAPLRAPVWQPRLAVAMPPGPAARQRRPQFEPDVHLFRGRRRAWPPNRP